MAAVSDFYDQVAGDYERMTDPEKRFAGEQIRIRRILESGNIRTALDAGCGAGFHSLVLASLGVEVTAVDLSAEMIGIVQQNAALKNYPIKTIQCGFDRLPHIAQQPFDAVVCLGNTLPHLLTEPDLKQAFSNFRSVLKESGVLVLQIVNYDRVLSYRERIQNIKERDGKTFIRFYDFLETTIVFNVLILERQEDGIKHTLLTTELRPWRHGEIIRAITEAGFQTPAVFGSLDQDPFDERHSHDLVVRAQ